MAFQISMSNISRRARGLQMGLINNAFEDYAGLQVSGFNLDGSTLGAPVGTQGAYTIYESTVYRDAVMKGLSIGIIMNAAQNVEGVQIGAGNTVERDLHGVQIAVFNYARQVHGAQVGLVNIAQTLHGAQLGAINIATKHKLPFMLVANAGW